MSGTVFDQLRDFKLAIGDHHILHDPRVVNLAGYNKYLFHTIFNNNGAKSIQGGDEMNFALMFNVGDTYSHPLPASFRQWKRTEQSTEVKQRWAKSSDHKVYVRDEMIRAKARSNGGSWFDVLFDLDKKLEQRLQVSRDKGLENDLHAVPDYATMENRTIGQGGILPASLFFHVNEDAFGMYGFCADDAVGTAANSVQRNNAVPDASACFKKQQFALAASATATVVDSIIEPKYNIGGAAFSGATESKYSPTQRRYTSNKIDHPDNIFSMLRSAYRAAQWEGPSDTKQWYENTEMNNFKFFTSDLGCRYMENMVKNGQDRWILGPQDMGIGEIMCFGIPIRWNPRLDKLAIYDGGTGGTNSGPSTKVVEDDSTARGIGPRIYGFNFNTLYPVTHEGMWNYRETMPAHFNVPDVWVEYVEDWWNTASESYREQIVVSPSGDRSGIAPLS